MAVLVSAAANVSAQSLYGTLVGNVTDETGAALPGASVTVTQRETNLSRDVMTNESGGYNVPNLLPGTYQVAVTLQGFKSYTARGIAVRPDLVLRVDARLGIGTLEESIVVSGTSVVLQTESAAVQSLTTADQLVTIPTSGRAWQTTIALMPGVAQPDYSQSGGSNNPTRAMAISINGQPANNTVVRLDGVTQINQFFQQIQAYSPSLESIETVSVVTNSFDADQGMAGGASVNVQVKSGTNSLSGSLFEFAQDYKMKATNYFLPPGDPKGSGSVHVFGGTAGGPIVRNKLFYFGSVESTRQRTTAGTALSNSGANGLRNLPTMEMRTGNFAGTNTVIYDPRTGSGQRRGARPVRVRELRHHVDDRSAVRCVQLHPGEPHQPDRDGRPEQADRADTAGISVELLRHEQVRHGLPEVRREDHVGAEQPDYGQRAAWVRDELRGQRARAAVCRKWRRHEWPQQPHLAGAHLGFHGPQSLVGDHQHRVL